MNKSHTVLFLTIQLLLAVLFLSAAFAESLSDTLPDAGVLYRIHSPAVSEDALLQLTFPAEEQDNIVQEVRGTDGKFWQIKDSASVPFCVAGSIYPASQSIQSNITIRRVTDDNYYYLLDSWNSIPEESGFAASRAEETVRQGLDLLAQLNLQNAEAVSFSTLGRIAGTIPCRKVTYRETLNGLPLFWSANCLRDDEYVQIASGCYAFVITSDPDGLLAMDADWCTFSPMEPSAKAEISQKAAAERFAENGSRTAIPELCYFLDIQNGIGTATLAWRANTSFLSALNGEWLQIDR